METFLINTHVIDSFIRELLSQKWKKIRLFKVGIDSYMVVQKPLVKFLHVPVLVRLCVGDIIKRGRSLEGIFRVPGSHNMITDICNEFENGQIPEFESAGPEEISGVFKKYLRELPHPLLSDGLDRKLADRFADVLNLETPRAKCKRLRKLLQKLSVYRRALLKEMFYTLYLVSLESSINKMDAINLGTIFGGMVNIISDSLSSTAKSDYCTFMILYFPFIWKGMDELKPRCNENKEHEKKNNSALHIQVFLDDGTFLSVGIQPDSIASTVCDTLRNKFKVRELNASSHILVEICDREIRLVGPEEWVYPIVTSSSILLFTGKLDLCNLKLFIPPNGIEDPNLVSEESMTSEDEVEEEVIKPVVPSIDVTDKEHPNLSITFKEEIMADLSPAARLDSPVASNIKSNKRTSTPNSIQKDLIKHNNKLTIQEKTKKRKSKPKKSGKLLIHSSNENIEESPDDTIESVMAIFQNQEKIYIENLKHLIQDFKTPLQTENILTNEDSLLLFPQIEEIINIHESLQSHYNDVNKLITTFFSHLTTYTI